MNLKAPISVSSSRGEYHIHFCSSMDFGLVPEDAFWIVDSGAWEHWSRLEIYSNHILCIEGGEESKNIETYQRCIKWLLN